MYENGYWQLDLKMPLLTHLVQLATVQDKHEKWPDDELLEILYDKITQQ